MLFLPFPANVPHRTAEGVRGFAVRQQDVHSPAQIVRAALGRRIVQRQCEIALSGAGQTLFDDLPRRETVRQRDDAEIVGQRRTQHRPAAEGGGQAGDDLHVDVRVLFGQLQQRAGHAVDPGVAGADQRHVPARPGGIQRPAAAVDLPGHAGGVALLFRVEGAHKVDVDRIAAQHLGLLQGALRLHGQKLSAAGAKPHDEHGHFTLTHCSVHQ